MKPNQIGLTAEDLKNLQETAQALKAAVAAACDELVAAAEAVRAAYMAARQEVEPTIDAIMAMFDEMEAAGEPKKRAGGIPCPQPIRRRRPAQRAVQPAYKVTRVRNIRPTARSSIKQRRNRRKP